MDFEYDPSKSQANREKHGVSLEEAKKIWGVPGVEVKAATIDEPRYLRVGKLEGKFYSCIYTVRGTKIRLISARRSRKEEEKIYEERIKDEQAVEKENQGR